MNIIDMYRKLINGTRHYIMRCRLKNKDFSIICPTCIGGVIYHHLKLQFKSPTVNLWLTVDDFYNFVMDLEWYISQEVLYYGTNEQHGFPIGIIKGRNNDDIKINFNHHKNFDDAKKDWDRRKQRINLDNLFVITSTKDNENKENIERWSNVLDKVKGLVCFTAKDYPDIPYALQLKYYKDKDSCGSYMIEGATKILKKLPWEQDFDYVKWLNTGKVK